MMRRRIIKCCTVVALLLAIVVGHSPRAEADRTCATDPVTLELECWSTAAPEPSKKQGLAREGVGSFLEWSRMWVGSAKDQGLPVGPGWPCYVDGPGGREWGDFYSVTIRNTQTDELVRSYLECVLPGDPAPEPPPPPPTLGELVRDAKRVITVDPVMNPKPEIRGLTGLDTWLWCEDPGEVNVGISLRGWTAAAKMSSVEYQWSIAGVSGADYTSTECGSEKSPAVTWMPETKGDHTVQLTSTWVGEWTLTWNGFYMGTFALEPLDIAADPVGYPVVEYYGVLEGE